MKNDIFNIEPIEPVIMDQKEFFSKTIMLLNKISNIYSGAWQNRSLKDEEFPDESICDKCTGCGVFKEGDIEKDCFQDKEQGWCYHRFCDYEQVGMELELQFYDINELLSIDELKSKLS